jgi:thiosulfate sulfurtransferase
MSYECISVEEAQALIKAGDVTLLDIRDRESFLAGNIETSVHVSNENVDEVIKSANKENPLIVYCFHGNNSKGAADYFFGLGFKKAYSVNGGFEEWKLNL